MDDYSQFLPTFLFVLLRASIVLNMLPYFSNRSIPLQFKIGMSVAIALIMTPVVKIEVATGSIPAVIVREIMFSMLFALSVRFIFYAIETAGSIMSSAMGLSMSSIINPEMGQATEVAQMYSIIVTLLFFSMDAHHEVITIFVKSYEWAPVGTFGLNAAGVVAGGMSLVVKILILALKFSAPVVISMLITNVLLGFLSKAAPQMNVFFVGYPLYIFLGFTTMILGLPIFSIVMGGHFKAIPDEVGRVMLMMKQ